MSSIDCDAASEAASYEYVMDCKDEEIARLRAEVQENEKVINVWRGRTQRAEADVEAYRKDAERYRWLRTDSAISAIPRVWSSDESAYPVTPLHLEFLDEAIDAAMGESA